MGIIISILRFFS